MAKRYVIVLEKIDGENAILNAETMRSLGIKDNETVTVTSLTAFITIPAVAGTVDPDQIKVPNKYLMVKPGDRVTLDSSTMAAPVPAGGPPADRSKKTEPTEFKWDTISDSAFDEIVGMENLKTRIEESLYYLTHPEWFLIRKSLPPRVFLLFGPYGCGKTMLARAMASRLSYVEQGGLALDVKFKLLKATDVKDPYLGMSAKHVQQHLDAARDACNKGSTVLMVLDEVDSLIGNRSNGNIHEEYRDIVNAFLQEVQGARELESEVRLRHLEKDPEVQELRKQLAAEVRKSGKTNKDGDIALSQKEWGEDIKAKLLRLRKKIVDAGGVSTVIIVGTTNDPLHIDDGFLSRSGDNVFYIPRPSAPAIAEMLTQQLDSNFVDLQEQDRRRLSEDAFKSHLTGRDILLSWLAPLRSMAPGALTIMGYKSIRAHMPQPTVDVEWEIDLYKHLTEKGHNLMAEQVREYLETISVKEPAMAAHAA